MAIGIGGWIIIAASIGARPENPIFNILGFLVFGGAILALQWIKCPRCSTRLGQMVMPLAVRAFKPQPNFCPYCGVSLDEPRAHQHQPMPEGPQNPIS